jgi:hypothetical protein
MNHLIAEVGAICYHFFLYVSNLSLLLEKTDLWINNQVVRMKFTKDRNDMGLIRFTKGGFSLANNKI